MLYVCILVLVQVEAHGIVSPRSVDILITDPATHLLCDPATGNTFDPATGGLVSPYDTRMKNSTCMKSQLDNQTNPIAASPSPKPTVQLLPTLPQMPNVNIGSGQHQLGGNRNAHPSVTARGLSRGSFKTTNGYTTFPNTGDQHAF
eukprot:CFRG6083T1